MIKVDLLNSSPAKSKRKNNVKTIGEEIIDFLNRDELLKSRTGKMLVRANKSFPNDDAVNKKYIENLVKLTEKEPETLIDLFLLFFNDKETITKIFEISRLERKNTQNSIIEKLDLISGMYEIANFFILPAYLLSNENLNYNSKQSNQGIFKYFKPLGLSSKQIDNMRHIRNAKSHKYKVMNESISLENGSAISYLEINELYEVVKHISTWWTTLAFISMLYIPKFLVLLYLSIRISYRNTLPEWNAYLYGLNTFYGDFLKEMDLEFKTSKNSKKLLIRKQLIRYRIRIKFYIKKIFRIRNKKNKLPNFFRDNFDLISNRLVYHTENLNNELLSVANGISDEKNKKLLFHLSKWLQDQNRNIKKAICYCENDPDKFMLLLKNKLKNKSSKIL